MLFNLNRIYVYNFYFLKQNFELKCFTGEDIIAEKNLDILFYPCSRIESSINNNSHFSFEHCTVVCSIQYRMLCFGIILKYLYYLNEIIRDLLGNPKTKSWFTRAPKLLHLFFVKTVSNA